MAYQRLHDCLLNRLFRRRWKKTSKLLRVTGLCEWNSPVTGEFPAQRASNAENVSIWWRHHGKRMYQIFYISRLFLLKKRRSSSSDGWEMGVFSQFKRWLTFYFNIVMWFEMSLYIGRRYIKSIEYIPWNMHTGLFCFVFLWYHYSCWVNSAIDLPKSFWVASMLLG